MEKSPSKADKSTFPTTGINKYVAKYISSLTNLKDKVVVDIPAGDGRASFSFSKMGAKVLPFDLFPNFFCVKDLSCKHADLKNQLPVASGSADYVICQEGIEHVSDQYKVFCEFNRVLSKTGRLLLTTPNLSNMRSRVAMLFTESDHWRRQAPSEVDSVWFSEEDSNDVYFGHLFLINIQKLRSLAAVSGFEIEQVVRTGISPTALYLTIFFYPFVVLANLISYAVYLKKNEHVPKGVRKKIFKEQVALNCSLKILTCQHQFVVFKKVRTAAENAKLLREMTRSTMS